MISHELEVSLNLAVSEAARRGHEYVTVEHVLYAILFDTSASEAVKACGGSIEFVRTDLEDFFKSHLQSHVLKPGQIPQPTVAFQRVIQRAAQHVRSSGKDKILAVNVLVAIYSEKDSFAAYFLQKQSIGRFDIVNFISHGITKTPSLSAGNEADGEMNRLPAARGDQDGESGGAGQPGNQDDGDERGEAEGGQKRSAGKDPLSMYTVDLCARAREGKIDPLIGRAAEVERTVQILCRRRKNNPLFVGDAGVGKTALAEGLALRIIHDDVPEPMKGAIIYSLDMGSLLAGSRYRGDFEQRLKALLAAIKKVPNAVLFIDEIHTVIGAGSVSGGSLDASNLLKPALASGALRCIGSTTFKEFRNHFESDHAFARRFQRIDIEAPSVEDTIKILEGLKSRYEDFHNVKYTAEAIKAAVNLSNRYMTDKQLPDKAIDVMDESGVMVALRSAAKTAAKALSKAKISAKASDEGVIDAASGVDEKTSGAVKKRPSVTVDDVSAVVAKMTRVPPQKVSSEDRESLRTLAADLKKVVFGQDPAIDALAAAIKLSRSGLSSETKPIGSFMFSGPTGVGKTEVAKQLAAVLGVEFLRFDMSEYMEKHTVSRLIGAPPGYVGFDQGGLLTDAMNKNPYAVLLLDEIEKAHPDLQNILLQVMDHGSLTDTNGRKADFRNAILIMTTNAGARELSQAGIGFSRKVDDDYAPDKAERAETEAIKNFFAPEFRNRLDALINFSPLSKPIILLVVDKFMGELGDKLKAKGVSIELTEAAREWLGEKGYDRAYGARPLGRLIQEKVKKPLADEVLFGKLSKGGHVKVEVKKGELAFKINEEGTQVPA